ncbi:MAG: Gfo/Idh/MocA family oxidoreductase [bacterium]|nr:Gfo/Idh/MocA family oxidoreductase [bacterium]
MNRIRVALAGVGGFGEVHVAMTEALAAEGLIRVVAFAEPSDAPPANAKFEAAGVPRYRDFNEMLASEPDLQLVCIASPIACHVPMARAALERGLHVYLEKPPAVRIQDLRELMAVQEKSGAYCAVGFQDVARPHVAALKRALCEGAVGTVRAIRAEARWQRATTYYARAPWAGKTQHDGAYVLDGPMNNSCAHVLNLCAYLAGDGLHEFARPLRVQGELYRAQPEIQGEDTNCLRAQMDSGVEVCIHLTQAASTHHPRSWRIIGDEGEAVLHEKDGVDLPGRHIDHAEPEQPNTTLLRRLVEVIQETDEPLLMPLAEAEGYLLLSNGAYESAGGIRPVPEEFVSRKKLDSGEAAVIDGIDDLIVEAARDGRLLSECGLPWATPTEPFDLAGYGAFPQRWSD